MNKWTLPNERGPGSKSLIPGESLILDLTKETRIPRREVVDGVKVAAVRCVVGICVVVSGVLQ